MPFESSYSLKKRKYAQISVKVRVPNLEKNEPCSNGPVGWQDHGRGIEKTSY